MVKVRIKHKDGVANIEVHIRPDGSPDITIYYQSSTVYAMTSTGMLAYSGVTEITIGITP